MGIDSFDIQLLNKALSDAAVIFLLCIHWSICPNNTHLNYLNVYFDVTGLHYCPSITLYYAGQYHIDIIKHVALSNMTLFLCILSLRGDPFKLHPTFKLEPGRAM